MMIKGAQFHKRALAHVVDIILITLIVTMPLELYYSSSDANGVNKALIEILSQVMLLVITIWMWLKYQGTPGKKLLNIKVVDYEGNQLGWLQATGRYFAYFLSIIPLGIGFLWSLIDSNRRCFHDIVSKSIVVDDD